MTSITDSWQSVLNRLKNVLEELDMKSWIYPLNLHSYQNGVLSVEVPTDFFRGWINENYLALIEQACH